MIDLFLESTTTQDRNVSAVRMSIWLVRLRYATSTPLRSECVARVLDSATLIGQTRKPASLALAL